MSENSSSSIQRKFLPHKWQKVVGLLLWVAVGFAVAQAILTLIAFALNGLGVSLKLINPAILQTVFAALVYMLTLVVVLGVPWWVRKSRTEKSEAGLARLPSWLDMSLAPAGFIVYLIVTAIMTTIATSIIPGFDAAQTQQTGFANLAYRYEYILAFATLVILAPLAEEILFRGYLFGKLRKYIPAWAAILLTSILFGLIHGQWNVGVDVFALSLVLCTLREITGSIWAGVLLHMMKNGLAFYLLFINPSLLNIMGG
jgi:membrane protease YdiL (CAAX protease family)